MKLERVMTVGQIRNQLEVAIELAKVQISFVVVPVFNHTDKNSFALSAYRRLQELEKASGQQSEPHS